MNIEIAALADAATEQAGKLNILGTFDRIRSGSFPFQHPLCAVVYRLRFTWNEQGAHRIRVAFIDADGRAIVPPLESEIQVRLDRQRESTVVNVILMLQGIKFEKAGLYRVDMFLDGSAAHSLPLTVDPA